MSYQALLDPVNILEGPNKALFTGAVLIVNREIKAFGKKAQALAKELGIKAQASNTKILAPCLVDPHSILEDPINGFSETLTSFRHKAAKSGYGQIALLPRGTSWRDRPENLQGFKESKMNVMIHLWGGFTKNGLSQELAPVKDLLNSGAIGVADDDAMIPTEILNKGLLLGELGDYPILVAPRDKTIQGDGILREGVECLRLGFELDPLASETIPLKVLIELQEQHPNINLRLMNLSTSAGVTMIEKSLAKPLSTVCWWHLIADNSQVQSTDLGLRISPSLGSPKDRHHLIEGLKEGTITAVSVHAVPLDAIEIKKPTAQRKPGITGHELVLPSLWQELVEKRDWSVEELWEVISFAPSRILNLPAEELNIGSRRWLLFDPQKEWTFQLQKRSVPSPSNYPWQSKRLIGRIDACGLIT